MDDVTSDLRANNQARWDERAPAHAASPDYAVERFRTDPAFLSDVVRFDATFTHTTGHNWNHGLGEIVTALLDEGMVLTQLVEHDSLPWNALPGQMAELENGEWRLIDRPERLPHSYTLQAVPR